jgi:hypothetical protein
VKPGQKYKQVDNESPCEAAKVKIDLTKNKESELFKFYLN